MMGQLNIKNKEDMSKNKVRFKSKMMITAWIIAVSSIFASINILATSGKDLFRQNCAACHKLSSQATTGPGLAGVTDRRSEDWLMKWIKNSQELVSSGDADAVAIFEEYNKMPMPPFGFSDEEIKGLITYIKENQEVNTGGGNVVNNAEETDEPKMSESNKTIIFWGVIVLIVVALYLFNLLNKVKKLAIENGSFSPPHAIPNFQFIFFISIVVGIGLIAGISYGLINNLGQIDSIFFGVFPYTALAIFIIGSIYRYTKKGYKVSSLSSQFLEGRKLFRGSQPFHWGLLVLFVGHLTAFLFPKAIIIWNGEPVRLLLLEFSSFAFAILALWGLFNLIFRRLSAKKLLVVSNKMDMIVYTVLLTQIISGLGVAFFVRWGSTWFASVLTPYLRSIFSFNPDLTAISDAPVLVQIHVISAFLIIALIPFTRFMHFLVAPIDYIWRKYQLVIWNWNRKAIRNTTRHNFGKKSRNH